MNLGRWSVLIAIALGIVFLVSTLAMGQSQPSQNGIANSLPSTNFSADGTADRSGLPRPAPGFANAHVASNPQVPDAKVVGEKTCIACHKLEADHFTHTLHSLGLHVANRSDPTIPVCEACHGPGSEHAAKPQLKGLIIGYTKHSGTPIDVQTRTCLTCHAGGPRDHWQGSVHQRNDLSCSDCHNPMAKFSVQGSMAKASINDTCAQCHRDIRLQFNRRSHMPLPEGQMSCDDCHNPHGTLTNPLLKTNTVNETCYQCHAEKRGPFLFEHTPVRENCLNCHDAHGSINEFMLKVSRPRLCTECHGFGHAPNAGPNSYQIMGRACNNCHTQVHGTNSPSGALLHR